MTTIVATGPDVPTPPWDDEPRDYSVRIETVDLAGGAYTLFVNEIPVVKLEIVSGFRRCRWQIYGPCDLDFSLAMMRGFHHLIALLGNEPRVHDRPPELNLKAPVKKQGVIAKWQKSKMIRRSKR